MGGERARLLIQHPPGVQKSGDVNGWPNEPKKSLLLKDEAKLARERCLSGVDGGLRDGREAWGTDGNEPGGRSWVTGQKGDRREDRRYIASDNGRRKRDIAL